MIRSHLLVFPPPPPPSPLLVPEFYMFSFCLPPFLLQIPSDFRHEPSVTLFLRSLQSLLPPHSHAWALTSHLPCFSVHLCPLPVAFPLPSVPSFWLLHTHPPSVSSISPHSSGSLSSPFLSATYLQLWGAFSDLPSSERQAAASPW